MAKVEAWKEERENEENDAARKFRDVDEAFRLYHQEHPDEKIEDFEEPKFTNYYKPSRDQKNGEMIFTGLAVGGTAFAVSRFV